MNLPQQPQHHLTYTLITQQHPMIPRSLIRPTPHQCTTMAMKNQELESLQTLVPSKQFSPPHWGVDISRHVLAYPEAHAALVLQDQYRLGLLGNLNPRGREMIMQSAASQPPPTIQYSAAQIDSTQKAMNSQVGALFRGSDAPDTGSLDMDTDMDMIMKMYLELEPVLQTAGGNTTYPVNVPETVDPGVFTVVPGLGKMWDARTDGIQSLEAFGELENSSEGVQMMNAFTYLEDQTWEKFNQPGPSCMAPNFNPPRHERLAGFFEPSKKMVHPFSSSFPGYNSAGIPASYAPTTETQHHQQQRYQHLLSVGSTSLPQSGLQQPLSGFQSTSSPSVSSFTGYYPIQPHLPPTNQFPPQHQVAMPITPPHSPHLTNSAKTYSPSPSLPQSPLTPGHHNRVLEATPKVITPSYADIQNHLFTLSFEGAPVMDSTLAAGRLTSHSVMKMGMLGTGVYVPVDGEIPYSQPDFFFAPTTPQTPISFNTSPEPPQKKRTAPNRVVRPRKTRKQAKMDEDDGLVPKWGNHWGPRKSRGQSPPGPVPDNGEGKLNVKKMEAEMHAYQATRTVMTTTMTTSTVAGTTSLSS